MTSNVIEALQPLVTDADEASTRRQLLAYAEQFATAGFVDSAPVAEAVVSTLKDTLAQSLSPVDHDHSMYQHVALDGAAALTACSSSISDDELNGILSEASNSPWLDDVRRVELPLTLATSAGRAATAIDGLPTAQAVADIVYNYEGEATSAATLWANLIEPQPDELALVLDRLLDAQVISTEFSDAARQAQLTWSPTQRRAFLDRYLIQPDSEVPSDLTLRAIGLATVDDGEVADLLCDRFSQATNNNQRQAVVDLWVKADIHDNTARKRLIETVIYGLIGLHAESNRNTSAVDLALSALSNLCKPLPHGVKGALGDRLKAAVDGNKTLEDKALRVLPGLGYSTSSRGFLGRKNRVDYTEA